MKDTRYNIRVGGAWSKEDFVAGSIALEWSTTPGDVQKQVKLFKNCFPDYSPQPNGSAKYYWAIWERGVRKWRSGDSINTITAAHNIDRIVSITGLNSRSTNWINWTVEDFKSGKVTLNWLKSMKPEIDQFLTELCGGILINSNGDHSFYYINNTNDKSALKFKCSGLQPDNTQLVDIRGLVQTNRPILEPIFMPSPSDAGSENSTIEPQTSHEKFQMVSRETMQKLWCIACANWREVIEFKLGQIGIFDTHIKDRGVIEYIGRDYIIVRNLDKDIPIFVTPAQYQFID